MIEVSSAAESRELDRQVIEDLGVPGIALMEIASRGVALAVAAHFRREAESGVVVACGPGNNGGDGYGVARWLHSWGIPVRLWHLSAESRGDAGVNRAVCETLGLESVDGPGEAGLLVDAVFGTGIAREVTGRYAEALAALEAHPAPVVAVDLPSGLHADTGSVLGVAVHAAMTVTFGRAKLAMYAEPGADWVGRVQVVDIGLGLAQVTPAALVPELGDLWTRWPRRAAGGHKGRSGHLLVVAGSRAMAGAAVLACRGALAAGAGLVTLAAPRGSHGRLGALPPEVMVLDSGSGDITEPLPERALRGKTAVAAGPGLGGGSELLPTTEDWLRTLWVGCPLPVVLDADALVATASPETDAPRVHTPHPGEAGRLLEREPAEVQSDRVSAARALAQRAGGTVLLKGRHTLVATPGRPVSINPTGGPVLSSGGAGDVLTGVVGALLCQGVGAHDAAILGAWVPGRAGDLIGARRSQGWTAGDVADALPDAIEELVG